MAGLSEKRQPMVDDLRVKLCYICQEEEMHDRPSLPPRRWVHPCKCTLVAHESCLLEWIQTSEQNVWRTDDQILKCSLCGSSYEMTSERRRVVRIFRQANDLLSVGGKFISYSTLAVGLYIVLSKFGALAFREFVGDALYQNILTDDSSNWPVWAWIHLPLIPLNLILGQISLSSLDQPSWTELVFEALSFYPWIMASLCVYTPTSGAPTRLAIGNSDDWKPSFRDVLFSWPPSPAVFAIGSVIVARLYERCHRHLSRQILQEPLTHEFREWDAIGAFVRGLRSSDPRVGIDVNIDIDIGIALAGRAPLAPPVRANPNQNVPTRGGQPEREVVWRGAGNEPIQLPRQIYAADLDPVPAPTKLEERPLPTAAVDVPEAQADVQAAEPRDNVNGEEIPMPNVYPHNATVQISSHVLGRVIAGGLVLPFVSARIGNLLLSLSLYSPLLRRFLGFRRHGNATLVATVGTGALDKVYAVLREPGVGGVKKIWLATKFGLCFVGAGSTVWRKADPVWWRSTLGLCIFVVARDMLWLCYLWLSQREIRSRKIKNRSFEGINPVGLDLILEWKAEIKEEF